MSQPVELTAAEMELIDKAWNEWTCFGTVDRDPAEKQKAIDRFHILKNQAKKRVGNLFQEDAK